MFPDICAAHEIENRESSANVIRLEEAHAEPFRRDANILRANRATGRVQHLANLGRRHQLFLKPLTNSWPIAFHLLELCAERGMIDVLCRAF